MASPVPARRVRPCAVCGGQCGRFPDSQSDPSNPFLGERAMPDTTEHHDEQLARPKGKRRPAEDRARHLEEDR